MNNKPIKEVTALVISNCRIKKNIYRTMFSAPGIARLAKPMQFVNIKVTPTLEPLLRRPFGISYIDKEQGLIEINWDTVGRGTALMSKWEKSTPVSMLGPLGKGFDPGYPREKFTRLYLVAGGTGLAPMYPLAWLAVSRGWEVILCYGARTREELMGTERFSSLGVHVCIATEDGSWGSKDVVTGIFKAQARDGNGYAVACGAAGMLSAMKEQCCSLGIKLYVSLESRMGCGFGLCQGCAVKSSRPGVGYYHVCTDGPVFCADDVVLEED